MGRMNDQILTVARELAEVSRLVDGDDVEAALDRFVARVVATVQGCAEASIVVRDEAGPVVAARRADDTGPEVQPARVALTDVLLASDGPLAEVLSYGDPHRIADAAADHRWPGLTAAMRAARYRSCLMLPLPVTQKPAAAFVLFSTEPDTFGETSFDVVLLFVLNAGVVFDNVSLFQDSQTLVGHLQRALVTRNLIGRSQGIVMHRLGLDTGTAVELVKRASQHTNTKLRDVARAIVDAQEQDALDVALVKYGMIESSA